MRRILTSAAAAAAASLALAAGAQADSISFIRGGDVWVASPDGAQQVQVTHDGGYAYASRADDGTFVALRGRLLRRLAPDGQLLNEFTTPVSAEQAAPGTSYFRGPFKPEISPDGTKVAYEYWHNEQYSVPGCTPIGSSWCIRFRAATGIGYSHADRLTAWDEPGLGRQSGWVDPSWIDNGTLLQSSKSVLPNVDAIIDHPGDGNQTIQTWFEDTGAWYVRDGEVSRRGDAAAFVTTRPVSGGQTPNTDDQVTVYRMNGPAPALPEQCFSFVAENAHYEGPTFAPDGARLAWTVDYGGDDRDDLLVAEIPSQAGGCQLPSAGGRVLVENATGPDWSRAPVPAAARDDGGDDGGDEPRDRGRRGRRPVAPRGLRATAARVALGAALRSGVRVTVRAPAAGGVRMALARRGRVLARGRARAGAAGRLGVTVRFTRAGRRALRGADRTTLTLRVRFTPAARGAAAVSSASRVTLAR